MIKSLHDATDLLRPGGVIALEGENFSGRTALICAALASDHPHKGARIRRAHSAYVGPEVYNALSGLAASVKGELLLHLGSGTSSIFPTPVASILEETGISRFMTRNPFTLSGGEQVCLAVASALCLAPGAIGFDCALEQLDLGLKNRLLELLHDAAGAMGEASGIVVADNRFSEFEGRVDRVHAHSFRTAPPPRPMLEFDRVDSRIALDLPLDRGSTVAHSMERASLELFDVGFSYHRGAPVLVEASASLQPGVVYVLEGSNGAGKSTLAKILCGCLKPDKGALKFGAREYYPWKAPGQAVGYHFQNPDLQLFSATVEEEIAAGPTARVYSGKPRLAGIGMHVDALLAAFGLTHVRREHPLDLPFVVRKRVALAATLAMGCPWVILDEPSLGQDDVNACQMADMIRLLAQRGTGVIVISHSPSFRGLLGASVLQLRGGRLSQLAHTS